jgi:hypothetical protein
MALGVFARKQLAAATPPEGGYRLAITGLALGSISLTLGVAIPVLMLLLFRDSPTSACRTETDANLAAAAVAQETVRARLKEYTADTGVLESVGLYRPIGAGACRTTPLFDITYADSAGYCMQITADRQTWSIRPGDRVRGGAC